MSESLNNVCKSIILYKLYCVKSTLGSNYKYLSCKCGISQDNWYTELSPLVKKANLKYQGDFQHRNPVHTLAELCVIRDGV